MSLADYIKRKKRMAVLKSVAQDYSQYAIGFRSNYSAIIRSAYRNIDILEDIGISIDMLRRIFNDINNEVNAHYEQIEDLVINKGITEEEAIKKVGRSAIKTIDIEAIEREMINE